MNNQDFTINEQKQLLCPICDNFYTHLEEIESYREKDNRLCVKLHFSCEAGHKFSLDFHQLEGCTYINDTDF